MRFPDLPRVWVNAEQWTPRLEAALEWRFTSVLGMGWQKGDPETMEPEAHPWILRYGGESEGPGHWIQPEGLLASNEIRPVPPEESNGDLLALIFWMGCRMEEFAPTARRDEHGRFDPAGCASVERGWSDRPVCEAWAFEIGRSVMGEDWAAHEARLKQEYGFETSLDVDSAYAFIGKGLWRTSAALGRDVLTGEWTRAARRVSACRGRSADPYDTYAQAAEWHRQHELMPRWFFLLARFGSHDKGLPPTSPRLQALMHRLEGQHPGSVQWHPGYAAAEDTAALQREHDTFSRIMGRKPVATRQHYLRLVPGVTRRRLIDLGIREDHTEAHAALAGFRGGFSRPRPWYDLEREALTPLMLHPVTAMDATLCFYMGLSPAAAPGHIQRLAQAAEATGGTVRLLWHNESLSDEGMWSGWADVYPNVLQACSESRDQAFPLA